jgi:hypothetical protein
MRKRRGVDVLIAILRRDEVEAAVQLKNLTVPLRRVGLSFP